MFPGLSMGAEKTMAGESPACGGITIDYMKRRTKSVWKKVKRLPGSAGKTIWKVGNDDPRRVIHSFKVGLSLTIVSLLYLVEPLYKCVGHNAIWAVMTVVVVLEFTAGATLCKGLNRALGTVIAGSLAFLIEYVANESGLIHRAIFIGAAVFFIGAASTYTRFIPYIKKNYDYGLVIFLLTFNLITVSSYRVENVLKIAHERLYTIAIGCGVCLCMSLLVFPNWSGEDLHHSTVSRLEGLAKSIEACVDKYFSDEGTKESKEEDSEDPIYNGYKKVLDSKSSDETLVGRSGTTSKTLDDFEQDLMDGILNYEQALHASWEPRHSRHCRYPWQQYVKLGDTLRHFGYTIVALHGCLQTEIQTPFTVRGLFKDPCTRLAAELSKALLELAESIRNRRHCSPEILSDHLHEALQDLNTALKSQPRLFLGPNTNYANNMLALAASTASSSQRSEKGMLSSVKTDSSALQDWKSKKAYEQSREAERRTLRPTLSKIAITSLEFSEALPFAAFASLLVEIVARLDLVIEEVEELGRIANFKEYEAGDDEIVIVCENRKKRRASNLQNSLPTHAGD